MEAAANTQILKEYNQCLHFYYYIKLNKIPAIAILGCTHLHSSLAS